MMNYTLVLVSAHTTVARSYTPSQYSDLITEAHACQSMMRHTLIVAGDMVVFEYVRGKGKAMKKDEVRQSVNCPRELRVLNQREMRAIERVRH